MLNGTSRECSTAEVGDERFNSLGMRQLYEAADNPPGRRERESRNSPDNAAELTRKRSSGGLGGRAERARDPGSILIPDSLQSARRRAPDGGALTKAKETCNGAWLPKK
jgi:hypothetical protein